MNNSDIISIVSLCAVTVFSAIPLIVKIFIYYWFKRKEIEFEIIGNDIRKDLSYEIYLHIINRSQRHTSITNILLNDRYVLLDDDKLKPPACITVPGDQDIIIKLLCPNLKESDNICLKIFTTRRIKPFNLNFGTIIDLINKRNIK